MRKSTTILKELEENKELIKAKGLLEDEKEFILDEIKDLEAELKKALEAEKTTKKTAAPKKRATVKKKTATRKKATTPKAPAKPKEKKFVMVDDKKVFEDDPKFCEIIIDQWKARKEAIKKAAGKRKTKSVIQRAAADVSDAVSKGIRNIKVEDIKKDPKAAIKKMERLEKAGREFLSSYKDILGEKITQKEIEEEFGGLEKAIKQIEAKYLNSKKKMADGGEVDEKKHPKFISSEDDGDYDLTPTGINSAKIDDVNYFWKSPSGKDSESGWIREGKSNKPNLTKISIKDIMLIDEGDFAQPVSAKNEKIGGLGQIKKIHGLYYTLKFKDGKKGEFHQKDLEFYKAK